MPNTQPEELTTEEAAEILKCSPRTVRRMIERGTIAARLEKADPTVQKGNYKIPREEVQKILTELTVTK